MEWLRNLKFELVIKYLNELCLIKQKKMKSQKNVNTE